MRLNNGTRIASVALALLMFAAQAPNAHHSVTMFDTETPVTVTGALVGVELINPHSFLYVEQQTEAGTVIWAVEGPSGARLDREQFDRSAVAVGTSVEACGYVLKADAESGYRESRTLVAEVLVMPDGKARLWSPYGNTLCRERNGYDISD